MNPLATDGIFALGFILLVAGVGCWSVAAAMVVAGVVLCTGAILIARNPRV